MHLNVIPRILGRMWALVLGITILVTVGLWGFTESSKTYESTISVGVIGKDINDAEQAERAARFITNEMTVYDSMSRSPEVLSQVIATSGVDISIETLSSSTVGTLSGQTLTFKITAKDAESASKLATAFGTVMKETIESTHDSANTTIVKAIPIEQVPRTEAISSTSRTLIVGVVFGLIVGICTVLLINWLRPKVGSAQELSHNIDDPVFFSPTSDLTEEARRIHAVTEAQLSDSDPNQGNIIMFTGLSDSEQTLALSEEFAGVMHRDGETVELISLLGTPDKHDFKTSQVADFDGNISKLDIQRIIDTTSKIVIAAPSISSNSDVLRLASKADAVIVTTQKKDYLKEVQQVGNSLKAVEANLVGYALTN